MTQQDPLPGVNPRDPGPSPGPPGNQGLHRKLTLNSISNVSRYAVSLVIAFVLTPFVVSTLGDSRYGFWVVLMSFVGYAGILELGVQPAVVRMVGKARGTGDRAKLEEMVSAAFLFFAGVGAAAALVFMLALPALLPTLARSLQLEDARLLLALIALDIGVMFQNYLYAGVLYGWQMYHARNLIDIASWVVNAVLLFLFLPEGGLVLIAAAKLVTDALALGATVLVSRNAIPGARLRPGRVSRGSFAELLGFGGKIFVSATATRFSTHAQPILISAMISASATAFFAIPTRLVEYARQIVWALATGFMPMFSELDGRKEHALIRTIYTNYTRYILIFTLPVVALIFVYGRDFVGLWINPEYAERGGTVLLLLAGAALLESLQPLLWRLFIGVGRLGYPVVVSSSGSLVTIALAIVLIPSLGIDGVAGAHFASTAVVQVMLALNVARYLSITPWALFRQTLLGPLAAGVLFFVLVSALSRFLGAGSYLEMAAGGLVGLAAYVPMVLLLSLTRRERNRLFKLVGSRVPGGSRQET